MPTNHRVKRAPKHPKVPKMTMPRIRKEPAPPKGWFSLHGGPWDGERILLRGPSTLVMRIGGVVGRYNCEGLNRINKLDWEAAA